MKKVITLLLTIIFIIAMITTVNAANENVTLTKSTSDVKPGEEFTVTVIANSTLNVTGISAGLSFDSTKLQLVSNTAGEGFTDMSGGDNSKIEYALTNTSAAKTNATICTLKFKVLETATTGTTATVNLSDIEMAVVTEDSIQQNITLETAPEAVINIIETVAEIPDDANNTVTDRSNETTDEENTTGATNSNITKNNTTKTDTTKKETNKIAQTGLETTVLFIIAGLSIVSAISYVAYKKYNNV